MLQQAKVNKQIQEVRACLNAPSITYLLFADDLVLFFKVTDQSCQRINSILYQFQLTMGLTINKMKLEVWSSANTPNLR